MFLKLSKPSQNIGKKINIFYYTSLEKKDSISYLLTKTLYKYNNQNILYKIYFISTNLVLYIKNYFRSRMQLTFKVNTKITSEVNYKIKYKLLKYNIKIIIRDNFLSKRNKYIKQIKSICKIYNLKYLIALHKYNLSKTQINSRDFYYCSAFSIEHLSFRQKIRVLGSSAHNIKELLKIKKHLFFYIKNKNKINKQRFFIAISPVFFTTTHLNSKPLGIIKFYRMLNIGRKMFKNQVEFIPLGGVNIKKFQNLTRINRAEQLNTFGAIKYNS